MNVTFNVQLVLYFRRLLTLFLFHTSFLSNVFLMTWVRESFTMPGRDTTAPCLLMDRQAVANHTLWWDMEPTKALYHWLVRSSLRVLKKSANRLQKMKITRSSY